MLLTPRTGSQTAPPSQHVKHNDRIRTQVGRADQQVGPAVQRHRRVRPIIKSGQTVVRSLNWVRTAM